MRFRGDGTQEEDEKYGLNSHGARSPNLPLSLSFSDLPLERIKSRWNPLHEGDSWEINGRLLSGWIFL